MQTNMPKRYNSLDFIKFCLAIVIVWHHFQMLTMSVYDTGVNFFYGKIYFGFIVEFFFIISGFLSAKSIEKTANMEFGPFILGKIKRIYPMAIIACASFAILLVGWRILIGDWYNGMVPTVWDLFTSFFMIQVGGAVNNVSHGLNYPAWYLSVLMICYGLEWLVVYVCKKLKASPLYAFIFISLMGLGCVLYEYNLPFYSEKSGRGYMAFFLGLVLYYIYEKVDHKIITIISIGVFIFTVGLYVIDFDVFCLTQQAEFTYVLFPSAMFIMLAVEKVFKGKIWSILGGASFEMFLWHPCCILILQLLDYRRGVDGVHSRMVMFIFSGFVAVWGIVIHLFIEKPLNAKISRK